MKPGYKQTEVGVIPEEWVTELLAQLCVKIQDGTHFSPKIRGNDFLYLTSKNIRFGYLDLSTADRIDVAQHDAIYKRCDVKQGDLLLTKDGANTGNAALNTLTEQFSLLSSVALLRFDPTHHSAAYFLQQALSADGQRRMKDAMSGNAITRLTLEKIRKLRFPVPPLPEQRAIATALSDVDGLLSGLDRLIAKKRDLKQAAMQQLLTGQTRLPGFHAEWEVKRLGEICEIAMGRTPPRLNQAFWGRGYKWLSIADLQTKVVSDSKEEITELAASMMTIIPKGTLLMSFKLSLGRLCFAGCDLFTNEAICSFNNVQANADFLYYVLGRTDFSLYGKQAVKGYTLNKESLKSIEVLLPPIPEQTAIAAVLTEMDAELAALTQRREKTRALKQAMMQELLTGRTRLL
jgi:type I restriction enzyme S subunit